HDPQGEWLYGVDFYVNEQYRRLGIGSKMYQARFNLVKRLNLRGMYAGGMLAGYHRYQQHMSAREYAEHIIHGELEDPTVTMQMRRGFKPRAVIENYATNPLAGNAAMLIEWRNPDYRPMGMQLLTEPVVQSLLHTA
ncbi:MAG: GNAT family N-acetyltransferase, partial [Anaerolineae bacterium]|nr:GNAT family N-acetyltransferase [Anaerolineae bacterium]